VEVGEGEVLAAAAAATSEDVQSGSENGTGIEQLLVLNKQVPFGTEVVLPFVAILVMRQILFAVQRLADAQNILVVL